MDNNAETAANVRHMAIERGDAQMMHDVKATDFYLQSLDLLLLLLKLHRFRN